MGHEKRISRRVIGGLMCNFALDKKSFEIAYLIHFDKYFAPELAELQEMEQLGMVELDANEIRGTAKGRLLGRNICMLFDRYLRQDQERRRYSRVI